MSVSSEGSISLSGSYAFLGQPRSESTDSFEFLLMQDDEAQPRSAQGLLPRRGSFSSALPQLSPERPRRIPGAAAATDSDDEISALSDNPGSGLLGSSRHDGSDSSGGSISQAAQTGSRWDPTVWGSALLAFVGLALAAAWLIASVVVQAPDPPSCIRYAMNECLYTTDPQREFQPPQCGPAPCNFPAEVLECPYAANGTFVREAKADPAMLCGDPFMEGSRRPLMPPCTKACCDGGLPGGFFPGDSQLPGSQTWQPKQEQRKQSKSRRQPAKKTCAFFQYTSSEVLHYLQSNRARLLVVGDSLQKQLHSRLVHMFRGAPRPIDHRIFVGARYTICRAADDLQITPWYDSKMKATKAAQVLEDIPGFFGQKPHVDGCTGADRPVVIDSLYSAWFEWQVKHLKAYMRAMPPGQRLILVLGVNYLERDRELPLEWLQFLDGIRKQVKVIVMTTPTGGVVGNRDAYAYRNRVIKDWTASVDAISLADFDAMSNDAHAPQKCRGDVHYMCWLRYSGRPMGPKIKIADKDPEPGDNVLRERNFGTAVREVYTTRDGECHDEMNRNLWQVIFNTFMKHKWS